MSVLVPELKLFQQVYAKVSSFKYHKTCDINYCYSLSGLDTDEKAKKFVKDLLWLNEMSYIQRYKEPIKLDMYEALEFPNSAKKPDTLQFLKFLECINYQIEIDTIKHGASSDRPMVIPEDKLESYELLQRAIDDLKSTVISELTKYRDLKWCDAI